MKQDSQKIYTDYYGIILHPTEPRLLILRERAGWGLPHFSQTERHFWQEVGHINCAIREQLGMDVTTLRCAYTEYNSTTKRVCRVYVLENHNPSCESPSQGRWIGRDELESLPLAAPEHRNVIVRSFDETLHSRRVPWYTKGWFATAQAWLQAQCKDLGIALVEIEQARSWERSSLWRIKTNAGLFYFKAVPAMFSHEISLTQTLAAWYPENSPKVIAIDADRGWMLMEDVEGQSWDHVQNPKIWEDALQRYAQIQIASAAHTDQLRVLGCPDRRLEKLIHQISALLADTDAMLPGEAGGLSQEEIATLKALGPQLKKLCAELRDCRIPHTLEHGDLWPGQIFFREQSPVFIDWSDAAISHPFFSLNFLSDPIEMQPFLARSSDLRTRLRDAYLEPWAAYEPKERLSHIFALADRLAPLYYATLYHQSILPQMEFKWEMERMLPFYVKKLLYPDS
ncbi:aminoglycoside phosphotransferase family protein [Candidatus Acetothermia bacterium]|jgi:hypothetical protein|nr:aminoglycoside phosphotransferase family protein [Candidatus Acetothermia bacterium]MCI2431308.1 aminoglycoside phosphotransferase family protein [Candidatus Acetothermia bacterium]MCI2436962.1 aminoglycoside phosphotransferase family protein [Candidatus Acetothermia bacterium]